MAGSILNKTSTENIVLDNNPSSKITDASCWTKFKRLFEQRGFDLEFEYNDPTAELKTVIKTSTDLNANKANDRKISPNEIVIPHKNNFLLEIDKEPNPTSSAREYKNFYDQFASVSENIDVHEYEFKKKAVNHKLRVSSRPSYFLTNIAEESTVEESDEDEEIFSEVGP